MTPVAGDGWPDDAVGEADDAGWAHAARSHSQALKQERTSLAEIKRAFDMGGDEVRPSVQPLTYGRWREEVRNTLPAGFSG